MGSAVAITAVQHGLCIKRNSSSAQPSLPASLHQCTGMSDAAAFAVTHHWGAGCFHHSFSFFVFYCLPLLFHFSSLSILKKYLDESFPLKPFEFLNSLIFDIDLDGNMPFTAVWTEQCQLNLPVLSNQIFKHPRSTALSSDNLCINIKNRSPMYMFVRDIKSIKEQQCITGIVNKTDRIFRGF